MKSKGWSIAIPFFIITNLLVAASPAHSITFGCKKAQREASEYLKIAYSSQNAEIRYLKKGWYDNAFSSFQSANRWFTEWQRIVKKSPRCFIKDNYVNRVRTSLKGYENNQTMATRYGTEIARRYNYGIQDPCFKYIGEDNALLACRLRLGEKEDR